MPQPVRPAKALLRARLRRVIVGRGSNWRADGDAVARALRRPRRAAHRDPPTALLLYGLGELLARAPRRAAPEIPELSRLTRRQARRLLETAGRIAAAQLPTSSIEEVGTRAVLTAPRLARDVWLHARAYLDYPPMPRPRLFGLGLVTGALLAVHPRELGHWLAKGHRSAINATVLAYLADRLTFGEGADELHRRMLQTGLPLLQAMAAEALARGRWDAAPMPFAALVSFAHDIGLDPPRAFGLAIPSVQRVSARLHHARQRLSEVETRLFLLAEYPEQAIGGGAHATDEMARLSAELGTLRDAREEAEQAADRLIVDIARAWPSGPSAKVQVEELARAFSSASAELAIRLAQELGPVPGTAELLAGVIDDMCRMLGLIAPRAAFAEPFRPDAQKFSTARGWTAKAISMRYATDPAGVGRRTGQLLEPLARAAAEILDAPHAAARRPQYGSALTRLACSILLATDVARGDTAVERKERARLMAEALEQAVGALRRDRADIDTGGWTDSLAAACVDLMRCGHAADHRPDWATDLRLPPFVRALAVWSEPDLVRADPARAEELFRQASDRASSHDADLAFSRALSLLDLALATGERNVADDVTRWALTLWPSVFRPWRALAGAKWSKIHLTLRDALARNSEARRRVLDDPSWAHSHCVEVIRSRTGASAP